GAGARPSWRARWGKLGGPAPRRRPSHGPPAGPAAPRRRKGPVGVNAWLVSVRDIGCLEWSMAAAHALLQGPDALARAHAALAADSAEHAHARRGAARGHLKQRQRFARDTLRGIGAVDGRGVQFPDPGRP